MRTRELVAIALTTASLGLAGCGSTRTVTVTGASSSSGSSSSPACAISYQDSEIDLSSGSVSCAQLEQQLAGLGQLWQSGGIADHPVTAGTSDPLQTACVLSLNGQTATISYGQTFGLESEAQLTCTDFVSAGWTQQ